MGAAQQAERAAFARQLLAVGRFTLRRMEQTAGEHDIWCVDDWEAIAAEVGAELGISRGRASSQMHYGTTLLERFPALGAVFLAGAVDFRVIAAAIFRTDLLTDTAALATIDAQLAAKAPSWNTLSREKITELVDWLVIELDPDAVRVAKQRDLDRHIEVGPGQNGMAEIWGEVRGPDAAAFDTKLNELAATVCPDDPRTKTQRRTDALSPLALGFEALVENPVREIRRLFEHLELGDADVGRLAGMVQPDPIDGATMRVTSGLPRTSVPAKRSSRNSSPSSRGPRTGGFARDRNLNGQSQGGNRDERSGMLLDRTCHAQPLFQLPERHLVAVERRGCLADRALRRRQVDDCRAAVRRSEMLPTRCRIPRWRYPARPLPQHRIRSGQRDAHIRRVAFRRAGSKSAASSLSSR